jgi:hypothetical protein
MRILARWEVSPERLGGARADADLALLVTLAHSGDTSVAQIGVPDLQLAELGGEDAGVDEEVDDGTVVKGGGQTVAARDLPWALISRGSVAGGKHELQVLLGVGDDGTALPLRRGDVADDVGEDELLVDSPRPQRREGDVDV